MSRFPPGCFGGCLPRETKCGEGAFPVWGTDGRCPVLPKDLLREFLAEDKSLLLPYHWHTVNQARQNSCTAADLCNIMMLHREIEGKNRYVLSQASLYAYDGITIHDDGSFTLHKRRSDTGMNLEVAMLIAQVSGLGPRFRSAVGSPGDDIPYIDQHDWQQRDWPDDVVKVSAAFRLGEAWDIPDYWAMLSAVKLGFGVARGMSNHCVGQVHPRLVLGSWEGYGEGNNGLHEWGTTEREINGGINQFGAWAFRCSAPSDAPVVPGVVPDIVVDVIRRRRIRIFGRRR